ncbi:hypothetical protein [Microbacterium sp. NPDC097977]|uniref:hypothetical protein n=1 Tax=Microbacterium sp. NPDC097977 TaxID=3155686 RepID=UPI00331DAD5A
MGRINTLKTHPQLNRILQMIGEGVPQATVAREFELAESTLSRFLNSRKSEMAKLVDDEPGVTDILSRLVEAADHARQVRRQSQLTGSPVAESRAIKVEADVLTRIITDLGIDDTTVSGFLTEAQALVSALKVFFRSYPDSAADLLDVFKQTPELSQLASALGARGIGKNK